MITVQLKQLKFFAHHGISHEEQLTGNHFEVNIFLGFEPGKKITDINDTIDYTKVYELVKKQMQIATLLLETLAAEIAAVILSEFSQVQHVQIEIEKLNAPIIAFEGRVGVKYELNRNTFAV